VFPTIDDLKKTAIMLLNDVCDDYIKSCSTGGFRAIKHDDHLELLFIISDWNSSVLNYGPEYEKRKILKTRKKKINIINEQ